MVKLAVIDLKAQGVDKSIANNLTGLLSVEISKLRGYSVISGDDMREMLDFEARKQMMGCDEMSCLTEIGGALGVEKIVVGSVGKLGKTFIITLRLINIRRARVENRISETIAGKEDQLIRSIKSSARRLMQRKGGIPMKVERRGDFLLIV